MESRRAICGCSARTATALMARKPARFRAAISYLRSNQQESPASSGSFRIRKKTRSTGQGNGIPGVATIPAMRRISWYSRSEEHTSELQSHHDLVCRLLLEKKKK